MAEKAYGYVGKIARINLTDKSVELIPTSKYVPKYIGGRSVCNKVFWDEVKPGIRAFDPESKLIYMTGPTTATGIPTGGRTVFTGISPNSWPEQYTWSGIGGWFGAELKFAGYDGFILEGKAGGVCVGISGAGDGALTGYCSRRINGKKVRTRGYSAVSLS